MINQPDQITQLSTVFKALADPTRLRMLGLIAERPRTGKELAESVGIGAPAVSHHIEKLTHAGIVAVRPDGQLRWYSLDERALAAVSRLIGTAGLPEAEVEAISQAASPDEETRQKVLKRFFDGRRLTQLPAGRKKRVLVLQSVMEEFDASRSYNEKEVNALLRPIYEDVATLRRELVDYGFVTRADGIYRVAESLPSRSIQAQQEISGDENAWLRGLISRTAGSSQPSH